MVPPLPSLGLTSNSCFPTFCPLLTLRYALSGSLTQTNFFASRALLLLHLPQVSITDSPLGGARWETGSEADFLED